MAAKKETKKKRKTSTKKHSKKSSKQLPLLGRILKAIFKGIFWVIKSILKLISFIFFWIGKNIFKLGKKGAEDTIEKIKKNKAKRELKKVQPQTEAKTIDFKQKKVLKGDITSFQNWLYKKQSLIGIILGARGTGKSAIGMFMLENFKSRSKKQVYALGFKQEAVPEWIQVIEHIDEIKNDSVLLIDEGGIEFSSRSSMSDANKLLSEILLIARHKDLTVLFITQNSSNLEINAIRQADFLLLKPSSLLQKDFERKKIKEVYEEVMDEFEEIKDIPGITYIYSDKFRGFATNTLPSFWSDKVSKGYAKK